MTKLVMITGASCTGKSSIILKLVQDYKFLRVPSFTTRTPRKGEVDGFDFWFISKNEFNNKFTSGEFIDPNVDITEFNGNNYGSPSIWLKLNCDSLNIVFSPTSTKVARILKDEYEDRVLWVHLIADEHGMINSNYGYYVFYQLTQDGKSQYQWVIERLLENLQSRRAVININSVQHKGLTKDFPCTLAIQFFVISGYLCCEVSSRSTDIITGLPYDMGFFSLLTELVYTDLRDRYYDNLRLGYTSMKSTFTQIYSNRNDLARQIMNKKLESLSEQKMPKICNASQFLDDIYNQKYETDLMYWIRKKSELVFTD